MHMNECNWSSNSVAEELVRGDTRHGISWGWLSRMYECVYLIF